MSEELPPEEAAMERAIARKLKDEPKIKCPACESTNMFQIHKNLFECSDCEQQFIIGYGTTTPVEMTEDV